MARIFCALVVLLLVCGCGLGGGPGLQRAEEPADRKLRIATWNLYYGADLTDAVLAAAAGDPEAIVAAVSAAYAQVQATDFPKRAGVIADEIVAFGPDLVGLQEAVLWRTQAPSDTFTEGPTPATDVALDFVEILLQALAARGETYEVASSLETFDAELPRMNALGELEDVRITDREVILVRRPDDPEEPAVTIHDADSGLYAVHLVLPSGQAIPQGWVSVDAEFDGQPFRFVSTHLEADYQQIRLAQADELMNGPAAGVGAVYVAGDFNTDALAAGTGTAPAYDLLTSGALQDAAMGWLPAEEAGTATRSADLDDPLDVLTERIDFVLHNATGPFIVDDVHTLGNDAAHYVDGLWPSDHAGVAVTLDMPPATAP